MIAVYSFWSKPYHKFGGGYWNDRHLLSSLAFSALCAKPYFGKTVMYCSEELTGVFHRLQIFDEIIPCFTEIESIPEKHWAVSKMLVYSKQTEPFLHIDNDVYFLKPPPAHIYRMPLMAQSVETHEDFGHNYDQQILAVDRQTIYPKYWVKNWIEEHERLKLPFSHNAGVLGGNHIDHIREYALTGIDYMMEYGHVLPDINTTIEQAYFAMYAAKHNIRVGGYIDSWKNTEQAQRVGFRHFWGGTKRGIDPGTGKPYMDGVIARLKRIKPEIFPIINKIKIKHSYV